MKTLESVGWLLVVVGALNWGLIGLGMLMGGTGWNVVGMLFGAWPMLEGVVYVLVGLAGVKMLWVKVGGKK